MRYSVRGMWKLSGEIATLRFAAEDEEAARRYADSVGVIALEVQPERAGSPEAGREKCDCGSSVA